MGVEVVIFRGLDLWPRLRAPARLQHHAQDAVDAKPRVPEALVGVALFVHFVSGPRGPDPSARATERSRSRRLNGLCRYPTAPALSTSASFRASLSPLIMRTGA